MSSARELLLALGDGSARIDGPSFAIKAAVGTGYVARNRRGRASLLLEVQPSEVAFPVGRVTGALTLTFATTLEFELGGHRWDAPCAVIECLDEGFLGAFCTLVIDLASRFASTRPAAPFVARALAEWERLFRCRRRLTENEELGLWAELSLIAHMPNVDSAIRAWRGPYGELTDFFSGGVGIECKASRRRMQHHISARQASRPRGEHPVYIVSMWVDVDTAQGQSLEGLVQHIDDKTTEIVAFEKGLLAAGYARADANLYTTTFVLLEDPVWFDEGNVPRVRAADPGVLELKYVIQLDGSLALPDDEVTRVIQQFIG